MGTILRIVGTVALIGLAFQKVYAKVQSGLSWEFRKINLKQDFSLAIEGERLIGILKIYMDVLNSNPVPLYMYSFQGTIKQGGKVLGEINTTNQLELPPSKPQLLSLDLRISAQDLVDRLDQVRRKGGILDPIRIKGEVFLSSGAALPVEYTLEFFAVN